MNDSELPILSSTDKSLVPDAMEDEDEAQSDIVSYLSPKMREVYEAVPESLRTLSEFELCGEVNAGPTEYKLRQNFHEELALARKTGKIVRMSAIFEDVITKQVFYGFYLKDSKSVAFITRPVVPHHQYFDAIFKEGLRKMFLYVKNHDLDPKTMATFAKIIDKAADRAIGPVAQRIQMHSKQEVTHSGQVTGREVDENDPKQLEAKIREMQAKLAQVKPLEIEGKMVNVDE